MYYIFIGLIAVGLIINYLTKKYALYNVSYKREISSGWVEIGEEFHISTIIENRKLLPVTFLQVTETFPSEMKYKYDTDLKSSNDKLYHTTTMMILPFQRIKRDYIVKLNKRGKYILRDVTLTAGDLVGLSTIEKQIEFSQELVVFPKPLDIESEASKAGDYIGDISAKRYIIEDPIVTAIIREYTGFEPEKTIHWPSTLKTGKLMVRNFDFTVDNSVFIILNIECSKPFWSGIDSGSIEKCYSAARKVIDDLESSHIKYGFVSNAQTGDNFNGNKFISPSLGRDHYYNILDSLGRSDYGVSLGLETLLGNLLSAHISCRTFVIITPAVLETYADIINQVRNYSDEVILYSINSGNLNLISDFIRKYII
ncbi:MAG: DUF58 domain-containing protein [Bacillota bacterium]|nr:DUF58 domain-containing protein [Bacillota bacterium]